MKIKRSSTNPRVSLRDIDHWISHLFTIQIVKNSDSILFILISSAILRIIFTFHARYSLSQAFYTVFELFSPFNCSATSSLLIPDMNEFNFLRFMSKVLLIGAHVKVKNIHLPTDRYACEFTERSVPFYDHSYIEPAHLLHLNTNTRTHKHMIRFWYNIAGITSPSTFFFS